MSNRIAILSITLSVIDEGWFNESSQSIDGSIDRALISHLHCRDRELYMVLCTYLLVAT
jgi:hypothetical protein